MEYVQESLDKMQKAFLERLDTIQVQLPSASPVSPSNLAAELASFKTFALTTFRALQAQISLISQQLDRNEMRARRKMLLIHGITEESKEDTCLVVTKTLAQQLDLANLTKSDISRCHRMGRAVANKPRPILVKFRQVDLRDKIWASKTGLKGSGITISEFLTKARHDLFMTARQRFGISKCWTREGHIYVLDSEGVRHRVTSTDELDTIPQAQASSATVTKATTSKATPAADQKKRKVTAAKKK